MARARNLSSLTARRRDLAPNPDHPHWERPDVDAALAVLADTRSPDRRQELIELVVQAHLALADGLARQYAHRGVDLDDLTQVARLGLLLAVERFRPSEGASFPAFAVPTIRGELKRYFRDHGWVVRPPRRVQELRARARTTRQELEQAHGHAPSLEEMAQALEVSPDELEECAVADTSFTPLSLDATTVTQDVPLTERLGGEASALEGLADVLTLREELKDLSSRERWVVYWRFVDGLTQSEIGGRLGVSQMQVSRILSGILRRLRLALEPAALAS